MPMKGHSERVPSKNVREFSGKPLLFWVLNELESVKELSGIYVDTDSPVIKGLVREHFGSVEIIDRPRRICGDTVPMNSIIAHDISIIEADVFLQTHVTNPLVMAGTFSRAIKAYFEAVRGEYDSLFSVDMLRSRLYDSWARPLNHDPANLIRTQDLEPLYVENSNFYIFSREAFESTSSRIGRRPYMYVVPKLESMDIDDEDDFRLAESLFRQSGGGRHG